MILKQFENLHITRSEANFDRACDEANRSAFYISGIDEDGHSTIPGWERTCCWIELEFLTYKKIGSSHIYIFDFKIMKSDEEC